MQALYFFTGRVIKGKGRGKRLNFPTANVLLTEKIPEGIYVSELTVNDDSFHAATFIGSAKTYNEKDYKAEVYILDFKGNIYGETVNVMLFKKLRENKKFSSEEALITQIDKDVKDTRDFFEKVV